MDFNIGIPYFYFDHKKQGGRFVSPGVYVQETTVNYAPVFGYEPMHTNRFSIEFPPEFNIHSYTVRSISNIVYQNNRWENIVITFLCPITTGLDNIRNFYRLIEMYHNDTTSFHLRLLEFTATGFVHTERQLLINRIESYDFGALDYNHENLKEIRLLLSVQSVSLVYGEPDDIMRENN